MPDKPISPAPVVWMTGLSGAGKTTIAQGVVRQLRASGANCLLLDGDLLRQGLCRDLGFSLQDRSENLRRAAAVAGMVSETGVPVVAALISPLEAQREAAARLVAAGCFFVVHVHADLHVVERRDPKGLYARARAGLLPDFTGVSSPYEPPAAPALRIDTSACTPEEAIASVLALISATSVR